MRNWSGARIRVAAAAVLVSAATGAVTVGVGGSTEQFYGAGLYVAVAALAAFMPPVIAIQVVGGQALVASLLMSQGGWTLLLLVPSVAGVVATAELLAVVARLDSPIWRESGHTVSAAGRAAVMGAGVFGAVALVGAIPGPTGLLAVVLASGACVVLARRLAGEREEERVPHHGG